MLATLYCVFLTKQLGSASNAARSPLSGLEVSSSPCSFPSLPRPRSYLILLFVLFFVFVSFSKQKESVSGKEEKAESFTT